MKDRRDEDALHDRTDGIPGVPGDYVPMRRPVVELDLGDGTILYDDDASLVHHLNPSASMIWQLCDGEATVGELAADIADVYGVDPARVRQQVAEVVAEFDALGLMGNRRQAVPS